MPASKEGFNTNIEKSFFVQKGEGGIRVIDQNTGDQFHRTKFGGWFWLAGLGGNPFDEDVQLGEGYLADYLNEIVATADNTSLISPPASEKKNAF